MVNESFSPDKVEVHVKVCFDELDDDTKFVNVVFARFFAEHDFEYVGPAFEYKSMCDAFVDEFDNFPMSSTTFPVK